MPRYRSRSKSRKIREKKRVRAQVPRDKRKLRQWAVRGTHKDYQKLREHATKHAPNRPSYVTDKALQLLQSADRRRMIDAAHQHENHWFTDGLAWLLDKVPSAGGHNWVKTLGQAALNIVSGAFGRSWDWSKRSSKHIAFDLTGPDAFTWREPLK